jgi:ATP-dependent Clp protease, protease subunit
VPDLAGPKVAYVGYVGMIDSAGATRIASIVNQAVNEQFDAVYLCMSSPGGYIGDGIFLYHHLKSLPIQVIVHNTGTVASIATTLFVAGSIRYCCPQSIFMMHPVTVGANGSQMASGLLQSALESALRDEQRTENILREGTRIPEEMLSARRTGDVYLTAPDALEYGLVHEVRLFTLPPGNKIFQI